MLNKKLMNKIRWIGSLAICGAAALALNACSESETPKVPAAPDGNGAFEDMDSVSVDVESGVIELPEGTDSLVVSSLTSLGGKYLYIALDDDPVDPSFDWDRPLESGDVISLKDSEDVRIVALDKDYRVVKVWTITKPEEKNVSSSSKKEKSSSSSATEESSSSEKQLSSSSKEVVSSSSEVAESSSSEEMKSSSSKVTESSSSVVKSSSSAIASSTSVAESSSSIAISSSSAVAVSSSSSVNVSSSSVVATSSSSSIETFSSSSAVASSSSAGVSSSSSEIEAESSSSVEVNEPQLPGSDFSSWDKSFWGSTSDAMATNGSGGGVAMKSSANAVFASSKLTLTSKVIGGSVLGITAGHKLATGVYFAGSFAGTDCNSLYNADGGYPGLENSDFSVSMNMGRDFTARPKSFDVAFAYNHVDGDNKDFPQKGLIYVLLVSADNKVVASGALILESSTAMATKTVSLDYGEDVNNILKSGYAIPEKLELGTGSEDVAKIYVMFASSAYAHVASTNYRGGEGSQLILDNFKLNY